MQFVTRLGFVVPLAQEPQRGPTLEIFQYAEAEPGRLAKVNRPGFGHIAFSVPSMMEAREQFLSAGGSSVGDVIETPISPDTVITWCYMRDPEGNVVELQSRSSRTQG